MRFPRFANDLKSSELDAANRTFGCAGSAATATSACAPRTCEMSTSPKDAPAAPAARTTRVASAALRRSVRTLEAEPVAQLPGLTAGDVELRLAGIGQLEAEAVGRRAADAGHLAEIDDVGAMDAREPSRRQALFQLA